MRKQETNRFIHSAYAHSISAELHKPMHHLLTDAPSAALPPTGGLIAHSRENIHFNAGSAEILRVGRASAKVMGHKDGKDYISLATATIEKLNILDVVTADRVVAKVTSVFPEDEGLDLEEREYDPAKFYLAGSHFDNLKIDGKPYDCSFEAPDQENGFIVKAAGATRSCIFDKDAREIYIYQFGTIYLGEKHVYGGKVILSMLRVELGCPDKATQSGPIACTNGRNTK